MGFLHPQNNQPKYGEKVEGISGHAVEGEQFAELANHNVDRSQKRIEDKGIHRGEEKARLLITNHVAEPLREPACPSGYKSRSRGTKSNAANKRGDESLFRGGIHQSTASESCRVEGSETRRANNEREHKRASRAKYFASEGNRHGVGAV